MLLILLLRLVIFIFMLCSTANDQCMIEKVSYALNEQTSQQMELSVKHCELVKLDNTSEFFPFSPYFSYDSNATECNILT